MRHWKYEINKYLKHVLNKLNQNWHLVSRGSKIMCIDLIYWRNIKLIWGQHLEIFKLIDFYTWTQERLNSKCKSRMLGLEFENLGLKYIVFFFFLITRNKVTGLAFHTVTLCANAKNDTSHGNNFVDKI